MDVFPENPCEFAVEFIRKMRNHPDIIQVPSSRQVLSIPRLILSRYYRKGALTPNDFIEISTVTSYPDNQDLARDVAFDILFLSYKKDIIGEFFQDDADLKEEDFSPEILSEMEQLQELIDEMGYDEAQKYTYNAQLRQRAIERNIRSWKRRSSVALDNDTKESANKKVREWQKKQRDHLEENKYLRRKYEREQIKKAR